LITQTPVAAQDGVIAIAAGSTHAVAILGVAAPFAVSLQAARSGNNLVLTWPTNAAGFTLQSTLDFTSPATWIDFTSPPAVAGANFTVTNSPTNSARFFQLRKP
jgi:hypothetical protein